MQPKLIINFTPLSETDFLAKSGMIVDALRANPNFPQPWLAPAISFGDLEGAFNAYRDTYHAAANGDRLRIAERDTARESQTAVLRSTASYLELAAQGDVNKLLSSGYDLRKDTGGGGSATLSPAPSDFALKRGDLSGVLIVHAAAVPGAASYECHTTDGDPMQENAWRDAGTFASCRKIELTGPTPGKVYWVRLRAINGAGAGPWTDLGHLMVV